jgi:hypothetical protein
VLAEVDEGDLLPEAQLSELLPDLVGGEDALNGAPMAFRHIGQFHFDAKLYLDAFGVAVPGDSADTAAAAEGL